MGQWRLHYFNGKFGYFEHSLNLNCMFLEKLWNDVLKSSTTLLKEPNWFQREGHLHVLLLIIDDKFFINDNNIILIYTLSHRYAMKFLTLVPNKEKIFFVDESGFFFLYETGFWKSTSWPGCSYHCSCDPINDFLFDCSDEYDEWIGIPSNARSCI